MKYYVSVTETLNKVVGVEAENEEAAVKLANDAYYDGDIVLDYDYIVDVKVELEKDQGFYRAEEAVGYPSWQEIRRESKEPKTLRL